MALVTALPLRRALPVLLLAATACAPMATHSVPPVAAMPEVYRVYDVEAERFIALDELAASLGNVDAAFFGEFHNDAAAHQAQLDLLTLLAERDADVVLGLEMFERDVQPVVDQYLAGAIDEAAFRQSARAWPNYLTDYRPLVEVAKGRGWPVLATNLPQELATRIARGGLRRVYGFSAEERRFTAGHIECARNEYWQRFLAAIGGVGSPGGDTTHVNVDPALQTVFEAQCTRDSTMAESVASLIGGGALVMHVNGAFHSDYFLGIVERLLLQRPDASVRVITAIPVADLASPPVDGHLGRADFLIFTPERSRDVLSIRPSPPSTASPSRAASNR